TVEPSPTTSTSTSTTSLATTSTQSEPAAFVLRSDGLGSFDLGSDAADVIDGLGVQLGGPATDETTDYPAADGLGQYTTADGETGFGAPVGRTVCWMMNLCVHFGGASAASLSLTGWTYSNDQFGTLRSAAGVTIGTRWSDVPSIHVEPGGCYSVGSGDVDGIRVTLESSGEPFGSFDAAGNYVATLPAAADVTVIAMEAGSVPVFLYGDC
ncbi:MAG: hypothetical protein WCC60_10980, partial [Ilumatobacteraceae bacterium]